MFELQEFYFLLPVPITAQGWILTYILFMLCMGSIWTYLYKPTYTVMAILWAPVWMPLAYLIIYPMMLLQEKLY